MPSSRGRPTKVTKSSHSGLGLQRRNSRQNIHDPITTAALAQAVASVSSQSQSEPQSQPQTHPHPEDPPPDAVMTEVDADAEGDSAMVGPVIPGSASENSAAAAIAAMSEQLGDIGGVSTMVSASSPEHQMIHHTHHGHHHNHHEYTPPPPPQQQHHHNSAASQYPMPPQSQSQDTVGKTTEHVARESGYNFVVDSTMGKRLAREHGMRMAIQRRAEQVLNLQRRSNVEALFAHIAGEVATSPCKNCHKGHGPWTLCVVVDGQMCGSCANCWFNASGARCSFHEARNPQTHSHVPSLLTNDSSFGMGPSSLTPSGAQGGPSAAAAAVAAAAAAASVVPSLQSLAPGMFAPDSMAKYHLDKALGDVRGADRKTRQLMMIEVAARQLALNIAQYEDMSREEQQQQQHSHQPQQSQQSQSQQQQSQQQQQQDMTNAHSLMDDPTQGA